MTLQPNQPPNPSPNLGPTTEPDAAPAAGDARAFTNGLVDSTSPYLLQHAHQPVDWMPWGEAAFTEATRRHVPIFLSVGYATCYWCHVMAREVFEQPGLAAPLNEHFVCVKVDREQRPDVDDLYMTAAQLLTGSAGWPLNVFLTPRAPAGEAVRGYGLLPYWAATYIPPEAKYGRPGFGDVVEGMRRAWADERPAVLDQAWRVSDAVRRRAEPAEVGPVDATAVARAVAALREDYDPEHGGFSGAEGPKFAAPAVATLLLADAADAEQDDAAAKEVRHTLEAMARGGIFDQVGGGFHRYSVDEKWQVPHFEKMLYDNGQMLSLYAAAYERWAGERFAGLYARVMRETADYLLREMCDERGAFWSGQDAEVNAREGGSYLWTPDQVRAALADEPQSDLPGDTAYTRTQLALQMYGLDRGTHSRAPHHKDAPAGNVLWMPAAMSEHVGLQGGPDEGAMGRLMEVRGEINAALRKARDARDRPLTDDKVLAGWNGLAIAGLADAGRVLGERRYTDAATRAADAVLEQMRDADGGLLRGMRGGAAGGPGFLEDYAFLAGGLLALDAARPTAPRFRAAAAELMAAAERRFAAPGGGWFDTLADQSDLFVRTRGLHDAALPSGSGQMIHNLLTLSERAEPDEGRAYADRAVAGLRAGASALNEQGAGAAHAVRALRRALSRPGLAAALGRDDGGAGGGGGAVLAAADAGPVAVRVAEDPSGPGRWVVTLEIAAGHHLNANSGSGSGAGPASGQGNAPELIATELSAAGSGARIGVLYPRGTERRFAFANEPLRVYEGSVELRVTGWAAGSGPLTLRYQACTDEACLGPIERAVAQP